MHFNLLGRSGLRVSPLCLGTMTFGTEWGWGSPKETAHAMLSRFLERGHNFIDTADGYTGGTSERIIGDYFAERGGRDRVVIGTKFTFSQGQGDPNNGGNGRKNMVQALEGSLTRLKTDYVDVLWMHAWDGLTPVREVLQTFADLTRAGKIRYAGLSNVPAWYLAEAQTLARQHGLPEIAGLQLEYSLVERNIEREHVPAARYFGLGLTPWSPLGAGLLTGKYSRQGGGFVGAGRLPLVSAGDNPAFNKLSSDRNQQIAEAVVAVARELNRSPAQVAINWITHRPAVASTIIGASKLEQLEDNLASLDFPIPEPLWRRLEEISRPELVHPYHFFAEKMRLMMTGGLSTEKSILS